MKTIISAVKIAIIVNITAIVVEIASSTKAVNGMNKIYRLVGKKGRTTIPFDIREKMKIGCNSLLSYEMKDENTIILRREKVCDHCSDHGVKEGSILDVVNSLTETEQKALHRYLSIKLSTGKEHR